PGHAAHGDECASNPGPDAGSRDGRPARQGNAADPGPDPAPGCAARWPGRSTLRRGRIARRRLLRGAQQRGLCRRPGGLLYAALAVAVPRRRVEAELRRRHRSPICHAVPLHRRRAEPDRRRGRLLVQERRRATLLHAPLDVRAGGRGLARRRGRGVRPATLTERGLVPTHLHLVSTHLAGTAGAPFLRVGRRVRHVYVSNYSISMVVGLVCCARRWRQRSRPRRPLADSMLPTCRSLRFLMPREYGWSSATASRMVLDEGQLAAYCARWRIARLELFGSVLRDDFRPESDVDILVTFEPEAEWGLLDHVAMEEELARLLGRPVDLVTRRAIERSAN